MYDTWCRWMFYLFLHKIFFYRIFYVFIVASEIAANGHVTIFIIIRSNKSFIYKLHSVKVSQQ